MRQLHQSQQNEKHLKLSGAREWYEIVFVSLKTNRTPVTQELYLDEKTMPHVYVIVSRIYGSYTRSYILMRKQCLMFMLLLATSKAVTQGKRIH